MTAMCTDAGSSTLGGVFPQDGGSLTNGSTEDRGELVEGPAGRN
jgi:hypothetical protein